MLIRVGGRVVEFVQEVDGVRMADGGWRMVEMNVEVEAGQWLKRLEESWVWNLSLFIQ